MSDRRLQVDGLKLIVSREKGQYSICVLIGSCPVYWYEKGLGLRKALQLAIVEARGRATPWRCIRLDGEPLRIRRITPKEDQYYYELVPIDLQQMISSNLRIEGGGKLREGISKLIKHYRAIRAGWMR